MRDYKDNDMGHGTVYGGKGGKTPNMGKGGKSLGMGKKSTGMGKSKGMSQSANMGKGCK